MKRLLVCAAVVAVSGCALDRQGSPSLSGPSEYGLSLALSATPDIITQDGFSQAVITVVARDAVSQPKSGLTLRAEIAIDGVPVDYGVLSSRTASTAGDGRASFTYLSPPAPPISVTSDTVVTIRVTPVGTNYSNSNPRTVDIKLTRPGVILPPNGAPVADFVFSPSKPHENEAILFDASPSRDQDGAVVSYQWSFGDGGTASGIAPSHSYVLAGDYVATLTVTDDRGLTNSIRKTVTVTASENPTANFTFSPTGPKVGNSIIFNASSSTVPTGRSITSYSWEWGDGSPNGSGQTASHAFTFPGTFTVTLTVTDNTGRKGVKSLTITVIP
jgi:PKD repeat protein